MKWMMLTKALERQDKRMRVQLAVVSRPIRDRVGPLKEVWPIMR